MDGQTPREHTQVEQLKRHIERREYTVGVIGLGYVGLPLVVRFVEAGFPGVSPCP